MFAKKNLIAAAALLSLAATAQAQSSVSLYGNLDAGVTYIKTKSDANGSNSTTGIDSSILTESYFGLKGAEDLGGGLKAVFKLESSIAVDTGAAGNFWDKNAYVGVQGGLGRVTLGNTESLFKKAGAAYNPFGSSALLAPTNNLFLGADDVALGGSWKNTVAYTSPDLGGLTVSVQHSAKEGAKGDSGNAVPADRTFNGGASAVAVNYGNGPLGLSAVYGDVRSTDAVARDVKERAFLLGASYDFGAVKGFAQYAEDKLKFADGGDSEKAKFFQLGAIVPVTAAGSVHASYGQTKVGGDKDRQVSLAYHHALSKRSSVYAGATYAKQEIGFVNDEEKTTAVAVGLRHAF